MEAQFSHDPTFKVDVNMVLLTFTVSDEHGKYVTGLKPADVRILEDGIPEKIVTFIEGSGPPIELIDGVNGVPGTSVFVLLDTSNRMYETLAHACDGVADFVRQLDPADSVAIYTFSRNMWRAAPLTNARNGRRADLGNVVAGDDTAVYNALLLTLRDAARVPGRKAIVLFSNGPDNASFVSPADVGTVALNEGIPIYVISTQEAANDRLTEKAFQFLTTYSGGRLYWAHTWQTQSQAFRAIHDDIRSSYSVSYYPANNPNDGFRQIRIEMASETGQRYRVRVRPGYDARLTFSRK